MKIQAQLAEQSCAQYTDSHNQSDIVGDDNLMTGFDTVTFHHPLFIYCCYILYSDKKQQISVADYSFLMVIVLVSSQTVLYMTTCT